MAQLQGLESPPPVWIEALSLSLSGVKGGLKHHRCSLSCLALGLSTYKWYKNWRQGNRGGGYIKSEFNERTQKGQRGINGKTSKAPNLVAGDRFFS